MKEKKETLSWSFQNNDTIFSPLVARNVQGRFNKMEIFFIGKFLSEVVNPSWSVGWDEESEIMKRLCSAKDTEKELKEGAKELDNFDDVE